MDLVRPLGLAGIPCALAARPGAFPVHSRFVRATFPWVDPAADAAGFVDALAEFAAAQPEPPVLFYEGDWDLLAISRNRERLSQVARFTLPQPDVVEDLADKARFQTFADALGLPVPRSVRACPQSTQARAVALSLPLVV
jgi:D-aspartate ligase